MKCPNCGSSSYLSSDATGTYHCGAPIVERDRRGNVIVYEANDEQGHKEGEPVLVGTCDSSWKLGDEAHVTKGIELAKGEGPLD